jgi:hypothetical protein
MSINYDAYLAANPDVAAAVARGDMTAEQHYNNYGQHEGRDLGGSTSGAQNHYWDSDSWQSLEGNGGGNNTTGIQRSSSVATPNLSNISNDASFYRGRAEFEGNRFNVGLGPGQLDNLKSMLDSGMSFNEAVVKLSGDGIGVEVFMPSDSGYLPYGIDLSTGARITGHGGGGGGDPGNPPPPGPPQPPPEDRPPGVNPNPGEPQPPPPPREPVNPNDPNPKPPENPNRPGTTIVPEANFSDLWENLVTRNPRAASAVLSAPPEQRATLAMQLVREDLKEQNDPFLQGFKNA